MKNFALLLWTLVLVHSVSRLPRAQATNETHLQDGMNDNQKSYDKAMEAVESLEQTLRKRPAQIRELESSRP
jgi:sensor histidine kinase YesM